MSNQIKTGAAVDQDSNRAAHQLCDQLTQNELGLMVFFCSPIHDLDAIVSVFTERLPNQPVIGCTTAGEVGPKGYLERGISGFSLAADICTAHFELVESLKELTITSGRVAGESLLESFEGDGIKYDRENRFVNSENCFVLSLIDGLSMREEPLIRAVYSILQGLPLIGGSAGDGLNFGTTYIYYQGKFHKDCGLFALVCIQRPVKPFKAQHFVSTHQRMVITGAIPEQRIVTEINGLPAAQEYARLVGITHDSLDPQIFAAHPVVVRIGGEEFVRSIQKVNSDGSLTFYCAIDIGVVLAVAKGINTIENLQHVMLEIRNEIGEPELIIGCDCILRRLEFSAKHQMDEISKILAANHVIGFSTYGEQYNGMHVNQTLTGLAIGPAVDLNNDK
jgi:hypothetical protein